MMRKNFASWKKLALTQNGFVRNGGIFCKQPGINWTGFLINCFKWAKVSKVQDWCISNILHNLSLFEAVSYIHTYIQSDLSILKSTSI